MTSYPPPEQLGQTQPPVQPGQPPQAPYPAPPAGYYPYMAPRRPAWPVVIGVISIVLASLGLICVPLTMGFNTIKSIQHTQKQMFPQWFLDAGMITSVVGMGQALLLVIAGILLAKRRPPARALHLVYGWLGVAAAVVNVALFCGLDTSNMPPEAKVGVWSGMAGIPVGLIYPVFLLVWFMRAKIAREAAGWPRGTS